MSFGFWAFKIQKAPQRSVVLRHEIHVSAIAERQCETGYFNDAKYFTNTYTAGHAVLCTGRIMRLIIAI